MFLNVKETFFVKSQKKPSKQRLLEKNGKIIWDSHWLFNKLSELIVLDLTQDSQSDSGESVKFLDKNNLRLSIWK